MTLAEVITQAYIKNGIMAEGEPLDANLGASALLDANILLEEWSIRDLMIWTTAINEYVLTARTLPTYWYEIGPTSADAAFVTQRPTKILRANLILTNSNPPSRDPLEIVDDLQWSDETVPSLGSAPYPSKLYADGSFPNQRLYLWPYPTSSGNSLELFTPNQVAAFAAITDTFSFPPGFLGAFMYTLSERTCEGKRAIPPSLALAAANARARFGSTNSAAPKISTIDGYSGGRGNGGGTFWDGYPRG